MAKKTRSAPSPSENGRPFERTQADDLWTKNPAVIKSFIGALPEYQQLCTEVEYILRKRVAEISVETSFIGSRAKTLNSFMEKLKRKSYVDPFNQLTDFAGARVVCLYSNDIPKVIEIVRREFNVIEEIDKLEELESNKFGYIGQHFIVELGRGSSGARYDDLKALKCEIQIRTVVQDAWSIIQHHMVYKNESQVPTKLIRKLNSLAALFETVDDQFELIRTQRDTYVELVRKSVTAPNEFLRTELNYDSFLEFIKWRFDDKFEDYDEEHEQVTQKVFDALIKCGFKNLGELNDYLDRTRDFMISVERDFKSTDPDDDRISGTILVALAISAEKDWRMLFPWGPMWSAILNKAD